MRSRQAGHYSAAQREAGMRSIADANGVVVDEFELPWAEAERRFLGNYDISVTTGGQTKTVHAALTRVGQEVKVTLP